MALSDRVEATILLVPGDKFFAFNFGENKALNTGISGEQCLVWAANLLHGGEPIIDPSRSRHTQVTHYYFEGCRYFSPLYSDVYRGQVSWSAIRDVRTGKLVPHREGGVEQRVPVTSVVRGALIHGLGSHALGRRLMDTAECLLRRT